MPARKVKPHLSEPVPQRDTAPTAAKMRGYWPHYLSRLINILNLRLLQTLRNHGMTVPQFRVVQVLDSRGTASIGEISADAVIEQSVVSRIVSQLEALGLAARRKRKSNSRIVDVYLTPLGDETFRQIVPSSKAIIDGATSVLSKAERGALEEMLERMFDHVILPHEPWLRATADDKPPKRGAKASKAS